METFNLVISFLIVVGVAAGVVALVAIGLQGRLQDRYPALARRLARAAQALNGEGETPSSFRKLVR